MGVSFIVLDRILYDWVGDGFFAAFSRVGALDGARVGALDGRLLRLASPYWGEALSALPLAWRVLLHITFYYWVFFA